ncbi:AAA family ATPase [Tengunoibacter tsumagoiensis]|uniref:Nuclease SbcCD subunit C n=1 Tax=Tengunoibacter tsumagoiensis TaxID=2014871 RepID=A0A401ZUY2_9CHLR|nr:AAA family ATPase [Tengunoibacter tsumagoiensis]GCE10719.1 hypothetical protein KTT_05780 [Tengunoibacter tsumagoiensis]
MIILKHLTIERFRLLRAMNLHFPQRGSILIQGPNEAGKSALIESLYFALYGEPLLNSRGKRPLDDLILYGASTANVTLTLSVGATELVIARTLERGRGQSIVLQIHRLGLPDEEPMTDLSAANERIIAELGYMDGDALRNTCFIEQKGLNRLETISGARREQTARHLLGLDKLLQLAERFQVSEDDELQLHRAQEYLQLAEIQQRIPQLQTQLETIETALDAVQVSDYLDVIQQQETEIAELEQALEQIYQRRQDLKSKQSRVAQLKRADATLAEIIASYDEIAEARREIPELERQLSDLERREREELPGLEKRVSELVELTRSFETLQRMSNDLLSAVDGIKEQEQDVRQYQELQQDMRLLEEQISQARLRLNKTQQSWQELDEKRRTGRPYLEDRLQRLQTLAERLQVLGQLEKSYSQRLTKREAAAENREQSQKVLHHLFDAEQELEEAEREAKQIQRQADTLEKRWKQLNLRKLFEEWQRQKALAQSLAQAEEQVRTAHQQQSRFNSAFMESKAKTRNYTFAMAGCVAGAIFLLILAFSTLGTLPILAVLFFIALLALLILAGYLYSVSYRKAIAEGEAANKLLQEATSRLGMSVAARANAARMAGNNEALYKVENEIRSSGENVPATLEEAQKFIEQARDQSDAGDLQKKLQERRQAAQFARDQVAAALEKVTGFRQERASLEELSRKEQWDNLEERLQEEQGAAERLQQEITLLAGQENLPLPSISARIQASPVQSRDPYSSGVFPPLTVEDVSGVPELETLVASTIKATEHELVSLDGKLDVVTDLVSQIKSQQDFLDTLLVRQNGLEERNERYKANNPEELLQQAREQQVALRSALQSLQDSLRLRVRTLGVAFGQAAIGNAEIAARKQLEEVQIVLGNRLLLQERHAHYGEVLRVRQESLSEYYKQLAKFSNTLGSWVVPLNPFAEALVALRTRCQTELEEAHEEQIGKDLESLQMQEEASHLKIELCRQEIITLHEEIDTLLAQYNRPRAKSYTRKNLSSLWPLLNQHSSEDRERLEQECSQVEKELSEHKKQEVERSGRLGTASQEIDLEDARARVEQLERSYQTKKRGNLMVKAVDERLLRKLQPRTERYMQQILPALTAGRYHDVHLSTDDEENTISGGPFQIQVWDPTAGEYMPTSALSGGAADQLSLALRLAFAVAALPRELSAAPGFILLDEPLSSFDRGRAQALVNVVTGELLSQHFEQIILVSHSSAFDPAMFPYHLYMDNGLMIESNLPVVPGMLADPLLDDFDDEEEEVGATQIVRAIVTRPS